MYMLQAGASPAERTSLQLASSCSGYACLTGSTFTNPGWGDDAAEMEAMRVASSKIGIATQTQADLFSVLAAVMHMSNASFKPAVSGDDDGLDVADPLVVQRASALMGCTDLSRLLLTRTVTIMSEPVTIQLTADQAQAAVSAFCKAVYALVFDWIVSRTNDSIRGNASAEMNSIGLLDVFGFETFEVNSFEQLCINFANERLHQFFLKCVELR